jgi:Tfp pilus assembly protein PilX
MRRRRHPAGFPGITLLEILIVMAILGMGLAVMGTVLFRADLSDNATELVSVLRRANSLAIENGEMHRVVFDLDAQDPNRKDGRRPDYRVEVCQGAATIVRNEQLKTDDKERIQAIERGKQQMSQLPPDAFAAGDPDEATRKATALSGHHIADRTCMVVSDAQTGDTRGKESERGAPGWERTLVPGVKFKNIWVQHIDDKSSKGEVAVYFFPMGSAEKAVIELSDGKDTYSILVHGLTGAVELRDGTLRDPDDHMLRNALGKKDEKRETDD